MNQFVEKLLDKDLDPNLVVASMLIAGIYIINKLEEPIGKGLNQFFSNLNTKTTKA